MKYLFVLSFLFLAAFVKASLPIGPLEYAQEKLKNISAIDDGRRSGRIVNGIAAQAGQFPYYVLLQVDNVDQCGGSLIKPNWVLTVTT